MSVLLETTNLPSSELTAPLRAMRARVSETKRTGNPPCLSRADMYFSKSLSICQKVKEIHRYVKCIHHISCFAPRSLIVRIYPVGYEALLQHLTSIPSVCLRGGFSCLFALKSLLIPSNLFCPEEPSQKQG